MPKSNAEELRILSRRAKVATLLLKGVTNHYDITHQLGMEDSQRSTISRDVTAIKAQWKESALRDFDEAKGRELEKLELLEREGWAAWERSQQERQSTRTQTNPSGNVEETKKEKRDGHAAYLEVVLKCITKRCALLGLDSPIKVAPTTPDGHSPWRPALRDLSDDELALLERLAERMHSISGGEAGLPN
jgi:hypothetical protein